MARIRSLIRTILLALPAVALAAASTPEAAIAERQAGFKAMGGAMKTLRAALAVDAPDAAALVAAATTLAQTAAAQGRLFPAGSGPGPGVQTAALPAIWTERAAFDAQMAALAAETGKLAAAARSGDMAALRAQAAATGAVCAACHKQFRAES